MPAVSVIVLHHDKARYSHACLESLLCSSARPLEIINVDNGSRDETPQILDEWEAKAPEIGIQIQRLNFETNIGAVRGRNEALAVANGDFLVFLDNDTLIFQSDWLEKLAFHLESRPNCGIVAPKLLFPWAPFDIECCGCGVSPSGRIEYLGRGQKRDALQNSREIQCAISAAWMMPRALIEKIGVLDELFSPVQYEDLDFCYRARGAGFSVETAPDVEVFHFEHTTTAGSGDINFRYVTSKNALAFKKRWSAVFQTENGPDEETAKWKDIPRQTIETVDWRVSIQGAKI